MPRLSTLAARLLSLARRKSFNLSAYLADLPTILDTMGYIYAGDSSGPGNGTALGLWGAQRCPNWCPNRPRWRWLAWAGWGCSCSAAGNNPTTLSPAPHHKVRGFCFGAKKVSPDGQF